MKKNEYSIYVIELDKQVLKHKKFKTVNPNYNPKKPCVYVGYTSKSPEVRFEEHISGARNKKGRLFNTFAKKYGKRLKPRLFRVHNPMSSAEEAKAMEKEKARRLRKRGYGVWQN